MERIIYLYRRKDGVSLEDARKWSLEVDLPRTSSQPGVRKFQVSEIVSSGKGKFEYHILEEIEADSYQAWMDAASRPAMKKVADEWPSYFDESSILEIRAARIK